MEKSVTSVIKEEYGVPFASFMVEPNIGITYNIFEFTAGYRAFTEQIVVKIGYLF